MGTAVCPAKTYPGPWDAFADGDMVVDEVLAEFEAMTRDGAQPIRSGPKPPLTGSALRNAVIAVWCVCFCGMQWRAIGQPCAIPFGTLDASFTPVLRELASSRFNGAALGDLGYRSRRLIKAGETLGITVEAIAGGRGGRFVPAGACWLVERSFAWLSRYRRVSTIFGRLKHRLIAFIEITFISILARRMKRLVVEELRA